MTVDPQRVGEIGPLVAGIGSDLAKGEISDDEFARAMKPVLRRWKIRPRTMAIG